jgi:hypothetical protein
MATTSTHGWRMSGGAGFEAGFSLVEALLVLLLTVVVAGSGLHVLTSSSQLAQAPPEAMDVQQRARATLALLRADLSIAGSGLDDGPLRGALSASLPAIVPRRTGVASADAATVAREDAMTILSVPPGASAAVLRTPVSGATPTAWVDPLPSCPLVSPACGIPTGATVLIADGTGRHALYVVTDVVGSGLILRGLQAESPAFPARAVVVPVQSKTYAFDRASRQLRLYDGDSSDTPVVDDLVDVRFEYLGDAQPPTRPRPEAGIANCLYDAGGALLLTLLPLPPATASLTPLPLSLFRDGPWCGDGDRQFDADTLRIRAVRVTLRVQAGPPQFRSPVVFGAGGGTNRAPAVAIPDLLLAEQVSPRNLNFGR